MPNIHKSLQRRFEAVGDLVRIEFHEQWGHNDSHFTRHNLVNNGVLDMPRYWYSPSQRRHVGLWQFNQDHLPGPNHAVPDTTLLVLLDDVTGELATRTLRTLFEFNMPPIIFTVNLKLTRVGPPVPITSHLFYLDAAVTHIGKKKIVIECPLFDAQSGVRLMVAKGTFVFPSSISWMELLESSEEAREQELQEKASGKQTPILLPASAQPLSTSDLDGLSRVMDFLPDDTIVHRDGWADLATGRLLATLDFGPELSGPPIFIHGGVLGSVLDNASTLLASKVAGQNNLRILEAKTKEVNYHKSVPLEATDFTAEAEVQNRDATQITISAKLVKGSNIHTSLLTTFTLAKANNSKL